MQLTSIPRSAAPRQRPVRPALVALLPLLLLLVVPLHAARAGYGSPLLDGGRYGLGIVYQNYTRDVYDVERDQVSNPEDNFAYLAGEARLGLWARRLELGIEFGRAHNAEDEFPERDYITWELGFTLRGMIYEPASRRYFLLAGIHYRDTVGFDRGPTLTHKLRRNLVGFGYIGRPFVLGSMPGRVYVGPHYEKHEFFDYGASYRPDHGPGEGETRDNWLLGGGVSLDLHQRLETAVELRYRNSLSFGLSALFRI